MVRKALKILLYWVLAFLLLASLTAYAAGETVFVSRQQIADNLEFTNTITWDAAAGRRESFTLNLTGAGDAYPVILTGDTVFGSTRITGIVEYAESLGLNVLAAVNADFFFPESGIPMGIVIEDGVYKSSPGGRNAVAFAPDGGVSIVEAPSVTISLRNWGKAIEPHNEEGAGMTDVDAPGDAGGTVNLTHFNKSRTEFGGMVLYSEDFSTVSTRTSTPGWFVRFRILDGVPAVSGEMTLEVTEKFASDGAVVIGEGNLILTAPDQSNRQADFEKFSVGDIVTLSISADDERVAKAAYATGGGDIIISDGIMTNPEAWFQTSATRAPRTVFGLRRDGTVITYVIDGRSSEHSIGMTLDEAADEFLRQDVVYAVNFDGGGSAAMSVRLPGEAAARVVSRPSDGSERGCASYLLFVTGAAPDSAARNLSMINNGVIVLAESSAELAFTATDRGYMPASVPADMRVTPLSPGSSVSGNVYTAGGMAATDRLALFSPSTGARGYGEVYVITRPTSISAARAGSSAPLQSVSLFPGQTLDLDITATYYRRPVIAQAHSFTFEVSGNIGEMTAPGVFEAGITPGQSGTIEISAGGRSIMINVDISGFIDMQNHWAGEYAQFLADAGITLGVTATEYGPGLTMRRGDFVLMLHRAAGSPAPAGTEAFDDVPEDAYYAQAVEWAREAGITTGTGGNSFSPLSSLTRQDAFTFVYRALEILGIEYDDGSPEDLDHFSDAGQVAGYAEIPTATLVELGVVEGSGGNLTPLNTLTRAEMAKVLATVLSVGE